MKIDDVFSSKKGNKVVVVGMVSSGGVRPGEKLQLRVF
jgi:selenocysteine-specific translation elongation factor